MKRHEAMTWIFLVLVLSLVVAVMYALGEIILTTAIIGATMLDLIYSTT